MPQEWLPSTVDTRNFQDQQNRVLDDLNRPDLANQAISYLQDAMRWYQRKPFFFTETDNTACPFWAANTVYTQGATIKAMSTVDNLLYAWVALNAGTSGQIAPTWNTNTIFAPPGPPNNASTLPFYPPPPFGTQGTITDSGIVWANNGQFQVGVTTGLSTVYNINQYVMPIELVNLIRVEVTWQGNLRIQMIMKDYNWIRDMDVVRPAPATYPAWCAWYQQQVYLWPYPVGLFPVTLSYIGPPPLAKNPTDSNVWTTVGEAPVRLYAEGLMNRLVMHDEQAATTCFAQSREEYTELVSQAIRQQSGTGVEPSPW